MEVQVQGPRPHAGAAEEPRRQEAARDVPARRCKSKKWFTAAAGERHRPRTRAVHGDDREPVLHAPDDQEDRLTSPSRIGPAIARGVNGEPDRGPALRRVDDHELASSHGCLRRPPANPLADEIAGIGEGGRAIAGRAREDQGIRIAGAPSERRPAAARRAPAEQRRFRPSACSPRRHPSRTGLPFGGPQHDFDREALPLLRQPCAVRERQPQVHARQLLRPDRRQRRRQVDVPALPVGRAGAEPPAA